MSQTKKDLRKRVDVAHPARKGYKTTSKRVWSTNKDHSKAERVIVCEVEQVPRVTSKTKGLSHFG